MVIRSPTPLQLAGCRRDHWSGPDPGAGQLQRQEEPGAGVQDQVENIQGARQPSGSQHLELLPQMRLGDEGARPRVRAAMIR